MIIDVILLHVNKNNRRIYKPADFVTFWCDVAMTQLCVLLLVINVIDFDISVQA